MGAWVLVGQGQRQGQTCLSLLSLLQRTADIKWMAIDHSIAIFQAA